MTTRNLALLFFLLLGVVGTAVLSGCQEREKVPAGEMKHSISRISYFVIQSVNKGEIDRARVHVAPEAQEQFDDMVNGLREGRYSQVLISSDDIDIDYRKGTAKVSVDYMKRQPGERRETRSVGAGQHLWVYENGVWSWHGPVPQRG